MGDESEDNLSPLNYLVESDAISKKAGEVDEHTRPKTNCAAI